MVTGFEVAGIVLGSMSLVIQSLENQGKAVSVLRRLCEYERGLQKLTRDLKVELVKFQDVCKTILGGLTSPAQIEYMIENPLGGSWRGGEIQRKIHVRLSRSTDLFEATMTSIRTAIDTMKGRIEAQSASLSKIKKGVLMLKYSSYGDVMSTIITSISDLERLTSSLKKVEAETPQKPLVLQPNTTYSIRGTLGSLTSALQTTLGLPKSRDVSLALEGTLFAGVTPTNDNCTITRSLVLHVGISFRKRNPNDEGEDDKPEIETGGIWQGLLRGHGRPKRVPSQARLELPNRMPESGEKRK